MKLFDLHPKNATHRLRARIALGTLKEGINGFDTASSLLKTIATLATGASLVAVWSFTIAVFAIGGAFSLILLINAFIDEYEKRKTREENFAKLQAVIDEIENNHVCFEQEKLKRYDTLRNLALRDVDNRLYLKYLIRDYLHYLETINFSRKSSGKYPLKNKIIRFVEMGLGVKKTDPEFKNKIRELFDDVTINNCDQFEKSLSDDFIEILGELPKQRQNNPINPTKGHLSAFWSKIEFGLKTFGNLVRKRILKKSLGEDFVRIVELSEKRQGNSVTPTKGRLSAFWSGLKSRHTKIEPKLKTFGKYFYLVTKRIIDFLSDGSTGFGIVLGVCALTGLLVAGAPVTGAILAVALAATVATGSVALIYNTFIARPEKKVTKQVEKLLKEAELKLKYIKRIKKINKLKVQKSFSLFDSLQAEEEINELSTQKFLDKKTQARRVALKVSPMIMAAGVGVVTGMGILWCVTVVFTAIPYLAPALVVGGLIAAFSAYKAYRSAKRDADTEMEDITATATAVNDLNNRLAVYKKNELIPVDDYDVDQLLQKDKKSLLKDVLEEYLQLLDNRKRNGRLEKENGPSSGKLPKQEKLLQLIETTANIKRTDPTFFKALNKFLGYKDDNECEVVKKLKTYDHYFKVGQGEIEPTKKPFKERAKAALIWVGKNILPVVGVVLLAISMPLLIPGPHSLVAIALVGSVILGAHVVQKVAERFKEKKTEELKDYRTKTSLIERWAKLKKNNNVICSQKEEKCRALMKLLVTSKEIENGYQPLFDETKLETDSELKEKDKFYRKSTGSSVLLDFELEKDKKTVDINYLGASMQKGVLKKESGHDVPSDKAQLSNIPTPGQ